MIYINILWSVISYFKLFLFLYEKFFSVLTNNLTFTHFSTELKLRNVHLQQVQNQIRHKTDGLSSSTLVLRRGQPFTILINYDGRPFDPLKDKLFFRIVLGMFVLNKRAASSHSLSITFISK